MKKLKLIIRLLRSKKYLLAIVEDRQLHVICTFEENEVTKSGKAIYFS